MRAWLKQQVAFLLAELEDVRAKVQGITPPTPGQYGPITTFVWKPGAGAGPLPENVFTDSPSLVAGWTKLVAAMAKVNGPKALQFTRQDNGTVTVPAGAWAMSAAADVVFIGDQSLDGGAFSVFAITVADGATFPLIGSTAGTCIGRIQNIRVNWSGVGTPPITLSTGSAYGSLANYGSDLVIDASTIDATGTTSEFIRTAGAGFGRVILENDTLLQGGLCIAARDTSSIALLVNSNSQYIANALATDAGGAIFPQVGGAAQACSLTQTAGPGVGAPVYVSQLATMTANRKQGLQQANAGTAPAAGAVLLAANLPVTKKQTGKYRVWWNFEVSNATLGDMTLTIQGAANGGGLAALWTQTITVPVNGNKVVFSGSRVLDGSAGFPLIAEDAGGISIFNAAITVGAGNFTTIAGDGSMGVEECG